MHDTIIPRLPHSSARLGVSRRADAWDEEYQSYLVAALIL